MNENFDYDSFKEKYNALVKEFEILKSEYMFLATGQSIKIENIIDKLEAYKLLFFQSNEKSYFEKLKVYYHYYTLKFDIYNACY